MIEEETAKRLLANGCYKALANLRKPDADPKAIASALRQQFQLIESELNEPQPTPVLA